MLDEVFKCPIQLVFWTYIRRENDSLSIIEHNIVEHIMSFGKYGSRII